MPGIDNLDEHNVDTYDQYVGTSVQLSIGDKVQTGKVTGRKRGLDGVARGKASANPILDTRTYNVEFPDGRSEEYTANVIAENMYAQCDEEGNQFIMLQDIVGKNTDGHAVKRADMYIKVGSICVSNGKMGQHPGNGWLTGRKVILLKWMSMPRPRTYMTSQLLLVGYLTS
jgi:hypothetical protein